MWPRFGAAFAPRAAVGAPAPVRRLALLSRRSDRFYARLRARAFHPCPCSRRACVPWAAFAPRVAGLVRRAAFALWGDVRARSCFASAPCRAHVRASAKTAPLQAPCLALGPFGLSALSFHSRALGSAPCRAHARKPVQVRARAVGGPQAHAGPVSPRARAACPARAPGPGAGPPGRGEVPDSLTCSLFVPTALATRTLRPCWPGRLLSCSFRLQGVRHNG